MALVSQDYGAKIYGDASSGSVSEKKEDFSTSVGAHPAPGSPKQKWYSRLVDEFKPAVIDEIDTTGMTEEEIKNARVADAPLAKTMPAYTLSLMAIGGSIGSGLFVGSGDDLATAGPASVILAFFVVGIMLYFMMFAAAEQAVRFDVSGSYTSLTIRLIDDSFGVACGWCYALLWLVTFPLELTSSSIIMQYWQGDDNGATNVNPAAWVALFWVVLSVIGCSGAYIYATTEAIFSLIKVITIVGFCIFGIIATCGGVGPEHHYFGAHYWHDPGAFNNGFKGFVSVFVNAAFACSGCELAVLASSESANPHKTLPSVVKQTFWRIILFYIVSLTICFCMVPSDDPHLGVSADGTASPFVLSIRAAGVNGLPSVINTVILLSSLSVGNASVFACSRTICAIAQQGGAPRFIGYIDRKGRPLVALIITCTFGLIGFIVASGKSGVAFDWMQAISSQATLFTWASITLNHIVLRWAMKKQGRDLDEQYFVSPYGIWGSIVSLTINLVILGLQIWIGLFPIGESPSAYAFFEIWLSLPIAIFIFAVHKLWYRSKPSNPATVDIVTGARFKTDVDRESEQISEGKLNQRPAIIRVPIKLWRFWC